VTEPQDQDAFKAVLDSIFEDLKEEPEPAIPEPEAYEDSEAELTASDSLEIHEASDEISIANFQELLTLANQPTTSQSVLILAGLYLTDVEETPRFTLSQLNRLTQEAGSAPMTHGDLQSAIEQEQLTLVADTHDTLDETHYMLTHRSRHPLRRGSGYCLIPSNGDRLIVKSTPQKDLKDDGLP
jgi:hypothetical protein